jgi:hypothetical protein
MSPTYVPGHPHLFSGKPKPSVFDIPCSIFDILFSAGAVGPIQQHPQKKAAQPGGLIVS